MRRAVSTHAHTIQRGRGEETRESECDDRSEQVGRARELDISFLISFFFGRDGYHLQLFNEEVTNG